MSTIGHRATRTTLALALAMGAALASTATVASTTSVRCHYTLKSEPAGTRTDYVEADTDIRGYWHTTSSVPMRSMFYTAAAPADLRAACMKKLAGIPDANKLAMVGAANGPGSYNHEIWYNGDQAKGKPIERIISFGDSLSDTGNMYTESQELLPSPSWYVGRFSNGPTWIEYLARRANVPLNNWAIGGARTGAAYKGLLNGVDSQIDSFFNYAAKAEGYDPSRTLFTFLVSGNDFVNGTKLAPQIVEEQEKALNRLVAGGARKILVVKLPDVSVAPVFTMPGGRASDVATVLGKVDYYNAHIREVATRVAARTKGTEIAVVNAREYFDELIAAPAKFGFTNVSESCLSINSAYSFNYLLSPTPRAQCKDPSTYVFWDTLHPTTRTHELMAGWAVDATPLSWGLRQK